MRICLVSKQYPAVNADDGCWSYFTSLANGLDSLGHSVTVLCSSAASSNTLPASGGVRVIRVPASKKISNLRLFGHLMPASLAVSAELLGYWQAMADIGLKSFDVVEAGEPLAGALLSAFSCELPTVLRVGGRKRAEDASFDDQFQDLLTEFAFACVDWLSCARFQDAERMRQSRKMDSDQVTVNFSSESAELAKQALSIYESAIHSFASSAKPRLYRHGAERLLKSTEDMMVLYDRMLYDLLFRVSIPFRVRHWFAKFRSEPGAFASRVFQHFGQKV